jgi:hypothetical protein
MLVPAFEGAGLKLFNEEKGSGEPVCQVGLKLRLGMTNVN